LYAATIAKAIQKSQKKSLVLRELFHAYFSYGWNGLDLREPPLIPMRSEFSFKGTDSNNET